MSKTERGEGAAGVVVKAARGLYTVQTDGGRILPCRLRGNLKKSLTYPESTGLRRRVEKAKKLKETDPIAVGDRVEVEMDENGRAGVIEAVEPRRASLARQSGNERERQTLVANLELAVIVFSIAEPRADPWKIDRFLVLAEDAELNILIVLNKADRASAADAAPLIDSYRQIGYKVLLTSARTGEGIAELRAELRGKISAFCGPSGVGKSTLLNALQPGLALKTAEVGDITFKGRHTTVQAELLPLTFGGWVADTPGLRQVEFWELPIEDVAFSFPEIAPLIGQCKFADCRHRPRTRLRRPRRGRARGNPAAAVRELPGDDEVGEVRCFCLSPSPFPVSLVPRWEGESVTGRDVSIGNVGSGDSWQIGTPLPSEERARQGRGWGIGKNAPPQKAR